MRYPILPRYTRTTRVPVENRDDGGDERTVTVIPARDVQRYQTIIEPSTYQQILHALHEHPELETRIDYDTTNTVYETYENTSADRRNGTWMFDIFVDVVLIILALALAGLIIGIMIGQNMLPPESVPFLLFVSLGIVLIIGAVIIVGAFMTATSKPRTEDEQLPTRTTVVTQQRQSVTMRRPRIRR
jgi:hypothetical protein